jgi:hypothetical protein
VGLTVLIAPGRRVRLIIDQDGKVHATPQELVLWLDTPFYNIRHGVDVKLSMPRLADL